MIKYGSKLYKKYLSEIALMLATIIWGGTFVIVKNSLDHISPMFFIGIRFLIAALILLPFAYKYLPEIDKKSLKRSAILGTLLFLGFAFQTAGLKFTSATKSGFITGSVVIFVPIFQLLIEKRKPTLGSITGSIIVITGLIFLSSNDTSLGNFLNELGSSFNFGDALTLICAVFFAMQIVYMDYASKRVKFWILMIIQIAVTSAFGFFSAGIFEIINIEKISFSFTNELIIGLAYTAILATVVTFGIQTKFQKEVSPAKAGIIFSFEPLFAALFAYIILSERISNFGIIGGILIFSGLIISEVLEMLRRSKEKDEEEFLEEEIIQD